MRGLTMKTTGLTTALLLCTACGEVGDRVWLYSDGAVTLDINFLRDASTDIRLSSTPLASPPSTDQGCNGDGPLRGLARQRLERGPFGDLDYAEWGSNVSLCGETVLAIDGEEHNTGVAFELGLGRGDEGFWGNLYAGGSGMDFWAGGRGENGELDAQAGSTTRRVWASSWNDTSYGAPNFCGDGQEWCELQADLTLTWAFSEDFVELEAW